MTFIKLSKRSKDFKEMCCALKINPKSDVEILSFSDGVSNVQTGHQKVSRNAVRK